MPKIEIVPASADRFADVEHALTGGGDGASCWCQWWMLRNKDFQSATSAERRELLRGAFRRLERLADTHRVEIEFAGERHVFEHPQPEDAYALALLHILRRIA